MGGYKAGYEMNIFVYIFSFLSGAVGAMGFGGGTVLIIYLSVFLSLNQLTSQGINLLFFIPCAVFAIIVYLRQNLIDRKKVFPLILTGLIGVAAGNIVLSHIETNLLTKLFGAFLIILSLKDILPAVKRLLNR